LTSQLYQQIGQLKVELDWLEKSWIIQLMKAPADWPTHESLSLSRQCELVGLPRASFYYQARGESEENLKLMRLLDEQYIRTPLYGIRRMTA
jgi:putative transposase